MPRASSSPANLWRSGRTLSGGQTYFEYERRVGHEVVIPFLERHIDLAGLRVADFSCHVGGVLAAFREDGRVAEGVGFDVSRELMADSPLEPDERFRLEKADLLTLDQPGRFDLILLLDVLEHVSQVERLTDVVRRSLAPGAHALVTFPPYWSPFGGHQHYASTLIRLVPYAHYLPERAILGLARIVDTAYMSGPAAIADMRAVRRTRLTLRRAEQAFQASGVEISARALQHAVRPEFAVRYGLRPRGAGALSRVPRLREATTMGAYRLVRSAG